MWTAAQRARHKVRVSEERKGYPTDVSDQEWKLIEPLPSKSYVDCRARAAFRYSRGAGSSRAPFTAVGR